MTIGAGSLVVLPVNSGRKAGLKDWVERQGRKTEQKGGVDKAAQEKGGGKQRSMQAYLQGMLDV
ncbi:hypothetical protein AD949_02625 [Acetobacter orleanensis]|uniref:Uncharacterized protein n=1 Tax=Acetobacter orleanensis TaxID=104099 RepID=A0A4Y3TPZ9_9PROT|nr:hypothetical protein AD949_02625 [Acetobacter orleanensis]GAN67921.1 hypothetical protein Abol_013_011 [Acetobacter orleanensis JCM 7639]GEB83803.1 hypothetical protein AOR01nite_22800 [Acetobacter orleanensis]